MLALECPECNRLGCDLCEWSGELPLREAVRAVGPWTYIIRRDGPSDRRWIIMKCRTPTSWVGANVPAQVQPLERVLSRKLLDGFLEDYKPPGYED